MAQRWLSAKEVARRFAVSVKTVYRWNKQGDLVAGRASGRNSHLRFAAREVERLEQRLEGAGWGT